MKSLFLDNNLSPRLAASAKPIYQRVEFVHLRDWFPTGDVTDEEWLAELASRGGSAAGWAAVTADRRIHSKPHQKGQWTAARVTTFFVTESWLVGGIEVQGRRFMELVPHAIQAFKDHAPGTGFVVGPRGKPRPM